MTAYANGDRAPYGTFRPGAVLGAILQRTAREPRGWLGRRAMFFWRAVGLWLVGDRAVDVERFGCRLRLRPAGNIAEKRLLFTPARFDPEERAYLAKQMRPDFRFADVGANVGGYALFVAAAAGAGARVLAVEPQPEVFGRLAANIAFSGFAQVVASPHAVLDREGDVTFYVDPVNQGESSLRAGRDDAAAITVQARRLGPLLADHGFAALDAMKIDVEGVEDVILADFFARAPRTLWPTTLIVEDSPTRWTQAVPQLIERQGYALVFKTRTNLVYRLTGPG